MDKKNIDIEDIIDDDIPFARDDQEITYDEQGNILKSVSDVFHESMLFYSEYVIMDRALPRVEDGLKPVQRRILYSMYDIGLTPDKPFKKSAKVVGDVIANYHPHGDTSAYGAMTRLAQKFNMGEILVEGHGNFGSIDGDPPAAMRYTEARLAPLALELLRDIDKDTVKWSFNFDDTRYEPDMLPSRYPNLLVNGSSGIAVGLATNIPTHNLNESIDACCAYIDNPNITLEEIMEILKGPDFPTGGIILGYDGLKQAYSTGKGKITIRCKAEIEAGKSGKNDIVITEFPYTVNKSACLLKITQLKEEYKEILSGIGEIRDESDKEGVRAIISIKAGYDPQKILNFLYKYSDLQISYGINMVAIADGKPRLLNLLDILRHYTTYQRQVIYNRTLHDLESAKEKAHILEGLIIAINNIEEVIRIIRESSSQAIAKVNLCAEFDLDEKQAQAILDMRLGRLTNLEVEKLEEDLLALQKEIEKLTKIVGSEKLQYNIVKKEMQGIKGKFSRERATKIEKEALANEKIDLREIAPPEDCVICIGQKGSVKRISLKNYNKTGRVISETTTMNEVHSLLLNSTTDSNILFFTDLGNCCSISAIDISESKWKDKGSKLKDLVTGIAPNENIIGAFSYKKGYENERFIFYASDGSVKAVDKNEFINKKSVVQAIKLKEGSTLVGVESENKEKNSVIMITEKGMGLRFLVNDLNTTGRLTTGIRGMGLNEGDRVIFARQVNDNDTIIVMSEIGYIKQISVSEFEIAQRGRKGLKVSLLNQDTGFNLIFVDIVNHKKEIYVVTSEYQYSIPNTAVPLENRTTKGKIMIKGLKQQKIKNVLKYEWDTEEIKL